MREGFQRNAKRGSEQRSPVATNRLALTTPGDAREQEADRLAAQALRMTETRAGPHVLRGASAPSRNGGQLLPEPARAFFEPRFGHDFSRVRVYADDHAAESARRFHADAYTVGQDVVFGRGLYAPETAKGRALLAHELAHTIQPMAQPVIARQKSGQTVQRSFEPDVMVFHDAEKNRSLIFVDGLLVVEVHRLELPTLAEADARFDAMADAFTLEITTTRLYTIVTIAPGALEKLEKRFRNVTIKINQTDSQSGPVLGGEPISIEQPDPELARPGRRRKRVTESVERGVPSIAPEIPSSADESSPPSSQDLSSISEAEVAAAPEPEESELASAAIAVTDVVTDFIPFVSNFKDAIIAVTGINPVTREKVGWLDRVIAGVFAIPGVGNVLKFIGKGGKLLWKGLGSLAKTVKKLGKALERVGRTLGTALDESAEWISEKARNIWERLTAPFHGGRRKVPGEPNDLSARTEAKPLNESSAPSSAPIKQEGGVSAASDEIATKTPARTRPSTAGKHPRWLPAFNKIEVDWKEIFSGHTESGTRIVQGKRGTLFGYNWSEQKIRSAVREAYTNSTPVREQGARVLLEGRGGGEIIEMWFNKTTKLLETAYPKL